jgi:hypothetical protein
MTVWLIHLLRAQKFCQHSLITSLAHRQREFFTFQMDYLSTPTALDRQTVFLRELFFIGKASSICSIVIFSRPLDRGVSPSTERKLSFADVSRIVLKQCYNSVKLSLTSG